MDKKEFEDKYIKWSGKTKDFYSKHFVTLPCNCNEGGCCGWACVRNDALSTEMHKDLYT